MKKKKFAIAGIGYIAYKHLEAIQKVGGELIAAIDVRDSVGILDNYFPDCKFFRDMPEFENYLEEDRVDYLTICTPNHCHLYYLTMADRVSAEAICEKPMVQSLEWLHMATNNANVILQMREDAPVVNAIKSIQSDVYIYYSTPRGDWYSKSWKGNDELSGGLLTNIGIHLFDLAIYCFGKPSKPKIYEYTDTHSAGEFYAGKKRVEWYLAIDRKTKERSFNNMEIGLRKDLHIESYNKILMGKGWHKKDIKPAMELINDYREIIKNL